MKVHPHTQPLPNEFTREVAVKKMRDEKFVIQGEAISLYPLIEDTFSEREKCALSEVEALNSEMLYTIIQKGSSYRKLFTFGYDMQQISTESDRTIMSLRVFIKTSDVWPSEGNMNN
jgi:hypothetical protein